MQKNSSENWWSGKSTSGTYSDAELMGMLSDSQASLKEMKEIIKKHLVNSRKSGDFNTKNTTLSNVFGVTFHTEEEVSKFLKISTRKLQMLRKEGEIGFDRIAGRIRYSSYHILEYLKKSKRQIKKS